MVTAVAAAFDTSAPQQASSVATPRDVAVVHRHLVPYSDAVGEYARFVENCGDDMREFSQTMAEHLTHLKDDDCSRADAAAIKMAAFLQIKAAAETGTNAFEVVSANTKADYDSLAARTGGAPYHHQQRQHRRENKESIGRWLREAGLATRAMVRSHAEEAAKQGLVPTASAEWSWSENAGGTSALVATIVLRR